MSHQKLNLEIFNKEQHIKYSEKTLGYSILSLRLVIGWVFLQAGLSKLLDPDWSAGGFLGGVPEANPFIELFTWFAGNTAVIDPLVIYGQVLIGLALILGVFFRFTALAGALQMLLFWLASFEGGITQGLPVEHGYLVNDVLVYALLLFGLGALGAGRLYGLDRKLEEHSLVEKYPWLKYLLG